ncbi:TauD/TfdA family dioxygenase [Streptomyces sp. NPDC048142]|uniref:TauD/TfdA family dioxygenase n=1 Tax=Streptomyces sp. NPDC048142 TaxID=3365501 RepID=UPI00371AE811
MGNFWHQDSTYQQDPAPYTMLHGVQVPSTSGHTLYANACDVYDRLPEAWKQRIADRTALHTVTKRQRIGSEHVGLSIAEFRALVDQEYPKVEHPLVKRDPASGRQYLYGAPEYMDSVVGFDVNENAEFFALLDGLIQDPDRVYTHRWTTDDRFPVLGHGEPAWELAARAARTGTPPHRVRQVIYAGAGVWDRPFWSPAAKVADHLGIGEAHYFEVANFCDAGAAAVWLAAQNPALGPEEYALVLVGDRLSTMVDYADPASKSLFNFGDAATAMENLPGTLRCERLVLGDEEDLVAGITARTGPADGYDKVLALSEFGILEATRVRRHLGAPRPLRRTGPAGAGQDPDEAGPARLRDPAAALP